MKELKKGHWHTTWTGRVIWLEDLPEYYQDIENRNIAFIESCCNAIKYAGVIAVLALAVYGLVCLLRAGL